MLNHSMKPYFVMACFLLLLGTSTEAQETTVTPKSVQRNILSRIESFVPPPYPVSGYFRKETYTYRKSMGMPVPKSLASTFAADIIQSAKLHLKLKKSNDRDLTPYDVLDGAGSHFAVALGDERDIMLI